MDEEAEPAKQSDPGTALTDELVAKFAKWAGCTLSTAKYLNGLTPAGRETKIFIVEGDLGEPLPESCLDVVLEEVELSDGELATFAAWMGRTPEEILYANGLTPAGREQCIVILRVREGMGSHPTFPRQVRRTIN